MNKYWHFGCLKNERLWGKLKRFFFSGVQSYKPDRKGGPGSQLSRPVHKAGALHKILSGDNFLYLESKNIHNTRPKLFSVILIFEFGNIFYKIWNHFTRKQ